MKYRIVATTLAGLAWTLPVIAQAPPEKGDAAAPPTVVPVVQSPPSDMPAADSPGTDTGTLPVLPQAPKTAPADAFVQYVTTSGKLEPTAAALIKKTWSECNGCDPEEFLTQGLAVLSPGFRDGLDAYDNDRYAQAATIFGGLRSDADPFVSINAAAYRVKALVQDDRPVDALADLGGLFERGDDLANRSYLGVEMEFLYGYCLLSDLQYTKAAKALGDFLLRYPTASQRLTVEAQQMLAELQNRQPGAIGEVVDLMNYCGRRLEVADAGDVVQERQQRVVDMLDKMIQDAENQEQQSSDNDSGGSGSSGNGKQSPSNPLQESTLPGGAGGKGELRSARRASPGEMWGAMPPAERAKVMQALRDSFPSRYRQLVEQYYEELAKKP